MTLEGDVSRADIESGEKEWLKSFNGGDAAAVSRLYADDGRLMPPNTEILQGRSAIEAFTQQFIAMKATLGFDLVAVHESPDMCVAVGRYEMSFTPPGADTQRDSGKYVEVWKRQYDGSWLIADDIFNASVPAPA